MRKELLFPAPPVRVRELLFLRGRGCGSGRLGRLSLYGLRLETLQNGTGRSATFRGIYREHDGSNHEGHRRPGCGPGERACGPARPEGGLAALAAESGGDVAACAALQQYDHDDKETNQDVNGSNEINHDFNFPEFDRRTSE